MKAQPKKKLSINKETIRRLTPTELTQVRGGDATQVDTTSDGCVQGTVRECII